MKPKFLPFALLSCTPFLTATLYLALVPVAGAASQTWISANGNNDWNAGTGLNWDTGVAWTQGNSAIFGGTGETVTLTEAIITSGLVFNSIGYSITGSSLTFAGGSVLGGTANANINSAVVGTGALTANSAGITTFGNAGTQLYSGTLNVNNGAVAFADGFNLGNGAGITITGGGGTVGGTGYPFKGVTRNGTLILRGSGDRIGAQTVTMNNGTLLWSGNGGNSTMLVQNVNANSGHNVITLGSSGNPNTLTLSNLTHTADSTVEFRAAFAPLGPTGEARIVATSINGSAIANTNGILGGWAFAAAGTSGEYAGQAKSFASWNGTNSIVAATPDKATGTTGGIASNLALSTGIASENWLLNGEGTAGNVTIGANTTINSMIASGDVIINGGATLTLASGGLILRDNNFWIQTKTGDRGQITSGLATGQFYVQADGAVTPSDQAIRVKVVDNGATAVKLIKSGAGMLRLDQINTYTGGTVINQGIVNLEGTAGPAGIIRGMATVNAGGTLQLSTGDATGYAGGAAALTTINLNGGALNVNSVANQTLGSATLNLTGGTITGIANSNLDFFGGGSALNTFAAAATSTISGVSLSPLRQGSTTFTIAQGTTASGIDLDIQSVIRNSAAGSNPANAVLIKAGTGTLALSGTNTISSQNNNSLRIDAGILMVGNGGVTGDLGALGIINNATLTFNRSDTGLTLANAISGTGIVSQTGTGRTILTGLNSYSGTTRVAAGTLLINGTHSGAGAVNVSRGAILGGTGTIAGAVNVSGVLAPGASIESLGTGSLALAATATLAYELNSLVLNGDLLASTGTLDIASGTTLTLTELASGIVAENSKLTLISYAGGWTAGELFTYNGTTLADDSTLPLGSNTWKFNYNDTSGGSNFIGDQAGAINFVTLTAVPEPGVTALLGGFGALALLRRRRPSV